MSERWHQRHNIPRSARIDASPFVEELISGFYRSQNYSNQYLGWKSCFLWNTYQLLEWILDRMSILDLVRDVNFTTMSWGQTNAPNCCCNAENNFQGGRFELALRAPNSFSGGPGGSCLDPPKLLRRKKHKKTVPKMNRADIKKVFTKEERHGRQGGWNNMGVTGYFYPSRGNLVLWSKLCITLLYHLPVYQSGLSSCLTKGRQNTGQCMFTQWLRLIVKSGSCFPMNI